MTLAAGPMELIAVKETNGRTGNQKRTTGGMPDGPSVQHYPGGGPVRQCVVHAPLPAGTSAAACKTQMTSERSYSNACGQLNSEERWRRVSETVWEVETEVSAGGGAITAPGRMLLGMPAAAAAQMKAANEAGGKNASAAMAPMLAEAQKALKSTDPQTVAMAQALIAQFKNGEFGASRIVSTTLGGQSSTVIQRYRRIADVCPKGSPK